MIHLIDVHDEEPGVVWYEAWEFEPPPDGIQYQVIEESWNDDKTVRTIHAIRLLGVG